MTDGRKNYEPTDIGNADRLVDTYVDHLRYCFPSKAWLIWDGSIALVITIDTKYVCIMAHYAKDYKARTAPSL
jgi:hypothetical protein